MSWLRGDGVLVDYDPVRSRRMSLFGGQTHQRKINTFFKNFTGMAQTGWQRWKERAYRSDL